MSYILLYLSIPSSILLYLVILFSLNKKQFLNLVCKSSYSFYFSLMSKIYNKYNVYGLLLNN